MLIWPSAQEASTTLDLLVTHTHIKIKIQGPSTSVKLLEIQWYGAWRDIPYKVKDKLLYLGPSTIMKEVQISIFWRQHNSYLAVLLLSMYQVTQTAASFEWGLECNKSLQDCCAGCSTNWTIWCSRPDGTWDVAGKWKCCLSLCQASICEPRGWLSWFWSKALPSPTDKYFPFEKQLLACY